MPLGRVALGGMLGGLAESGGSNLYRQLGVIAFATLLGACGGGGVGGPATAAPPSLSAKPAPVDASTPDLALKAYWAWRDTESKAFAKYLEDYKSSATGSPAVTALASLAVEDAYRRWHQPEAFSRDILEVKIETPSRAVILTRLKNVTPVPDGATLNEYQRKARENGEFVKYLMTSDGKSWKVAEIWREAMSGGQRFEKVIPDESPFVPSLVYNGI